MGILRTDVVSHSQLQPTGSVFFDGTDDKITTTGPGNIGTSDFTLECWVYLSTTAGIQRIISANEGSQSTEYLAIRTNTSHGWQAYIGTDSGWWEAHSNSDHSTFTTGWHHVVLERYGNDGYIFVDGQNVTIDHDGSSASNAADPVTWTQLVLGWGHSTEYLNAGYISNARVALKSVYKGKEFTVPKFELKPIEGTYLLCCQSSSSSTEAAVAPAAGLTVTGAAASAVIPDVKKDITDTGVVLEDNTKFDTLSYMVPPGGTTTESNRGRAIFMGGYLNPSLRSEIYYVQMQSQGNALLFGDLSGDNGGEGSSCASSTRALQGGGSLINTINYITIATTSNSTDFGDITIARRSLTALSSNTRGIWAGGTTNPAMSDVIDYATIATTGNATDFGNLTEGRRNPAVGSITSTTRGVFAGGNPGSSPLHTNVIDYITIASTGNATDFGDQVLAMRDQGGASSSIRGLIAGGYTSPANLNRIEYITIASTGNAADFGDLNITPGGVSGTSNKTRALFAGGSSPYNNSMEYATIATLGNAKDFGDLPVNRMFYGGTSDSHGGIS